MIWMMIWRDETSTRYLTPEQRGIGPDEPGKWVYVGLASLKEIDDCPSRPECVDRDELGEEAMRRNVILMVLLFAVPLAGCAAKTDTISFDRERLASSSVGCRRCWSQPATLAVSQRTNVRTSRRQTNPRARPSCRPRARTTPTTLWR